MKVILLEDVKPWGKKGDIVNVSDGYARNMILPKKLGVEASKANLNDLKLQKANEEKVAQENLEAAKAFAKDLESKDRGPDSEGTEKAEAFRLRFLQGDLGSRKEPAGS